MRIGLILVIVALVAFGCSDEVVADTEFPTRSVTVNGTEYQYRIYVPEKRDPNSKIPVMLYLHGSGARGSDNQSQVSGVAEFIRNQGGAVPFIIVMPQCREGGAWTGDNNQQALKALDDVVKEFNGDVTRLYLAGYSMGGNGTWQNGVVHAGKFAALVPIAGEVAPRRELPPGMLEALPPKLREAAVSPDPYKVFAEGIGSTAVWVFHGSNDDAVPVTESRKVVEALKKSGNANVAYSEYENVGHDSLGRALAEPKLIEWLSAQRLNSAK